MTSAISLDTGVLVEFIDEAGTFHSQATVLMGSVLSGGVTGLVPHPVFAELYYVSSRLYEKLGQTDFSATAGNLIRWLYKTPNVSVPESNLELALEAGTIKAKFGLALTDSYVLAAAKLNGCKAVFKSPEQEMKRGDRLKKLQKERFDLIFLEDYSVKSSPNF